MVMPSIYENPFARRNVYYWPGLIVAAGRLHPDKKIEPRIARTDTDEKMPFLLLVLIRDLRDIRGQSSLHRSRGKRPDATARRPRACPHMALDPINEFALFLSRGFLRNRPVFAQLPRLSPLGRS